MDDLTNAEMVSVSSEWTDAPRPATGEAIEVLGNASRVFLIHVR